MKTKRSSSPGMYGKVPSLGDFVNRRLPAHFVDPWDNWLRQALAESGEQLGSSWLDLYLISPIWRFVLSPGACGEDAWAGIMMPSVDKGSRYFPLTLALPIEHRELLPWLFCSRIAWFDRLEALALSALEDRLDIEAFDRELAGMVLTPFLPGNDSSSGAQRVEGAESRLSFRIGMGGLPHIRDSFVHLSACLLAEFLPVYSLWCTDGSEWVKPSLIAYDGLPPAEAYTEFLTGRRQRDNLEEWLVARASLVRSHREAAMKSRDPGEDPDTADVGWRSNSCTHVGCVRKVNQDSCLERSEIGLWAVADGMGGHAAGEMASKVLVTSLGEIPPADDLETLVEYVESCLHGVNADLLERVKEYGPEEIMGTTVVALLVSGGRCAVAWLGDSRLYRYREGILTQMTSDHSVAAELSRMGVGTRDKPADAAMGNEITRAVGASSDLEIDTLRFEAWDGDLYLLCSDGLTKELTDTEIADFLGKTGFKDASRKLVGLALERRARDNVTALVIEARLQGNYTPERMRSG